MHFLVHLLMVLVMRKDELRVLLFLLLSKTI